MWQRAAFLSPLQIAMAVFTRAAAEMVTLLPGVWVTQASCQSGRQLLVCAEKGVEVATALPSPQRLSPMVALQHM